MRPVVSGGREARFGMPTERAAGRCEPAAGRRVSASRRWRGRIGAGTLTAALTLFGALAQQASAAPAPGSLDTTFGTGGITLTNVGASGVGANGIVRESDGSFAVVGVGPSGAPTVAHYTSSGAIDGSFGSSGSVTLPTNASSYVLFQPSMAYQPTTGDLIVAGTWEDPANLYTPGDYGLVAIKADGSLDTNFGTNGIVDVNIGAAGDALAVAVDPTSGEIYVGGDEQGATDKNLALAAFTATGTLDTGFGTSGSTVTTIAGGGAQITALTLDGSNIVAAGDFNSSTGGNALVMRYTSAGALDSGFNSGTPLSLMLGDGGSPYSGAQSVLVQSATHEVVIGGYGTFVNVGCMTLARVTSAGALDTTFGSSGQAHLCANDDSTAYGIAQSSDGYIYAAGNGFINSSTLNQVALGRFSTDGAVDTSFGTSGLVLSDAAGTGHSSDAQAMVLDGTNPVIAGQAYDGTNNYFALERFVGGGGSSPTSAPVNVTLPQINASSASVGQTLTGTAGTWSGSPNDYYYKWYACPTAALSGSCHDVQAQDPSPAQTTNQYTVAAADVAPRSDGVGCTATGCYLVLWVKAYNTAGGTEAVSASIPVGAAAPPTNTSAPTLSIGTGVVGEQITASAGGWAGSPQYYVFYWEQCASNTAPDADCKTVGQTPLGTGTTSTYTPTQDDAGKWLRVWVKTFNGYGQGQADSMTIETYGLPTIINNTLPSWTGNPIVGGQLIGHAGSWSGSGSTSGSAAFSYGADYIYRWLRCPAHITNVTDCKQAVSIFGASTNLVTPPDSSPYKLTQADFGYRMELAVYASNPAGLSVTAYAPKTTPYIDDAAGTLKKLAQASTNTAKQGAKQVPSVAKILADSGNPPKVTFTIPSPADLIMGGAAWVIAAGGGNVIAAGGGNVIAAGGGNVIAAGGGNVIAARGGNLAGHQPGSGGAAQFGPALPGRGGWILASRASGRAGAIAPLKRKAKPGHRRGKLVTLFRGERRFTKAGRGQVVLHLTKAGRKLLKAYEQQVAVARKLHRKLKPIVIGFVTVTRPLHGKHVGESSVKLIKLRP